MILFVFSWSPLLLLLLFFVYFPLQKFRGWGGGFFLLFWFFFQSADSERKTALAWNIGLLDGKDFASFGLVALGLGGFARTGLTGSLRASRGP